MGIFFFEMFVNTYQLYTVMTGRKAILEYTIITKVFKYWKYCSLIKKSSVREFILRYVNCISYFSILCLHCVNI